MQWFSARQGGDKEVRFHDKDGREHKVYCYEKRDGFVEKVSSFSDNIHLDIDLDYFVDKKIDADGHETIELSHDDREYDVLNDSCELMKHLRGRLFSLTIAREPEHCGGVRNSNEILERISSKLFYGDMWGGSREGLQMYRQC